MGEFVTEYGLWIAYILLVVAGLLAIVLPLVSLVSNPKSLIRTLGGVVLIVVLFFVSVAISDGEVSAEWINHGIATERASKLVGGSLIMMYAMGIITILVIVVTEIRNVFK